ncbi:MAG: hypothetical protein K8R21_10190, partial [Leptospira sp.]|nr:hypothetical protein [Leptospira sp.]
AREETNYSSFMKKVLHHKDKELNNLVLVFTDGKPGDFAEAIQNAEKLKRNKIDYIQILLAFETDDGEMPMDIIDKAKVRDGYYTGDATKINKIKRSPDEIEKYREKFFGEFSEIAKRANGNQAILKINDVAKMVSIEFFDRYVGILSMATPKEAEAVRNEALQGLREFSKPVAPPPETGPKIRAWSPKKL